MNRLADRALDRLLRRGYASAIECPCSGPCYIYYIRNGEYCKDYYSDGCHFTRNVYCSPC